MGNRRKPQTADRKTESTAWTAWLGLSRSSPGIVRPSRCPRDTDIWLRSMALTHTTCPHCLSCRPGCHSPHRQWRPRAFSKSQEVL